MKVKVSGPGRFCLRSLVLMESKSRSDGSIRLASLMLHQEQLWSVCEELRPPGIQREDGDGGEDGGEEVLLKERKDLRGGRGLDE